jgi:hypothetical protein
MIFVYCDKRGRRICGAFLGTSQEEGMNQERRRRRKPSKQKKTKSKCNL